MAPSICLQFPAVSDNSERRWSTASLAHGVSSQRFGDAISWTRDTMPWVDAPRRCSRGRLVRRRSGRPCGDVGRRDWRSAGCAPFFPRRTRRTTRAVLDFGPPSLQRFPRAVRCPSSALSNRLTPSESGSSSRCAEEDPRCPRVLVASPPPWRPSLARSFHRSTRKSLSPPPLWALTSMVRWR